MFHRLRVSSVIGFILVGVAVGTVGAEGWEHAKTSFEQASRELAETWHKIHPEDK